MSQIEIKKIGVNGEGIGFEGSLPVFICGALPGDIVEYRTTEKSAKLIKGEAISYIRRSKDRRNSPCKIADKCDGCPLIGANYNAQLAWKKEQLVSLLKKNPNFDENTLSDVIPNPNELGYRNLVKLPIMTSNDLLSCGLYKRGTNKIVRIDKCVAHEPELENVRLEVLKVLNDYHLKEYDRKKRTGMRYLYLRGINHKYQLGLVSGTDHFDPAMIEQLMAIPGMNSIYQNIQTAHNPGEIFGKQFIHLAGTKSLSFKVDKLHLCLSLPSFYQMNTVQAVKLYETVSSLVPDDLNEIVEAYCGIGTMSLLVKDKAKKVTGIEFSASSIRDANEALKRNDAKNVKFIQGDAGEELTKITKKRPIDLLIVDPPRTGLDAKMVEAIEKGKVPKVIYVSCNPYTLALNLNSLKHYKIEKVLPLDIFSGTTHLETIISLERTKK